MKKKPSLRKKMTLWKLPNLPGRKKSVPEHGQSTPDGSTPERGQSIPDGSIPGHGQSMPDRSIPERKKKSPDGSMGLTDHLRELRNRILICLGVLTVSFLIGLRYVREMVELLLALGEQYQYRFVYIAPQELLLVYFAVDFVFAACVTLPVLFYEIWAFLRPGLNRTERLLYLLTMVFGTLFACLGIWFAYQILLPFMLYFLISLSVGSEIQAAVSVQNYISFLMTIFMIFAAIFELPVVTVLLTQLNVLKVTWMKRLRKVMIVVIFFVAAVVTPPDVFSQIMVALPLILLYELSIILCTVAARLHPPQANEPSDESDEESDEKSNANEKTGESDG